MTTRPVRSLAASAFCSLLTGVVVAAPPQSERPVTICPSGDTATTDEPISVHDHRRELARRATELRRHARQTLRREALTEGTENLQAVGDLVDVYVALRLDRTLPYPERRRLAGKVRSRLMRARKDLIARHGASPRENDRRSLDDPSATARFAERAVQGAADAIARLLRPVLAQQGAAGPAGFVAGGAVGVGPQLAPDYGQDLADLIQTVIAPSTWERRGGPGTIYYYRPLRVLVIRQTGEVHDEIGGVIRDLRRAGN